VNRYDIPLSDVGRRALEEYEAERQYAAPPAPDWQAEIRRLRAELAELRHQVRELQTFKKAAVPAIGDALAAMRTELEAKQLRFMGVYEPGRTYRPNSLVVRSGGLWCALSPTTDAPGRSSAWQLVTKSGEVG
jgi:hypothetical protein